MYIKIFLQTCSPTFILAEALKFNYLNLCTAFLSLYAPTSLNSSCRRCFMINFIDVLNINITPLHCIEFQYIYCSWNTFSVKTHLRNTFFNFSEVWYSNTLSFPLLSFVPHFRAGVIIPPVLPRFVLYLSLLQRFPSN